MNGMSMDECTRSEEELEPVEVGEHLFLVGGQWPLGVVVGIGTGVVVGVGAMTDGGVVVMELVRLEDVDCSAGHVSTVKERRGMGGDGMSCAIGIVHTRQSSRRWPPLDY